MTADQRSKQTYGHEAERRDPGMITDGRGDAGATPPRHGPEAQTGTDAEGLAPGQRLPLASEAAERAKPPPKSDRESADRREGDAPLQAAPPADRADGDYQAFSSQTPVAPDRRVGSAQDGGSANERSDALSERAEPGRHGGSGDPGWKQS